MAHQVTGDILQRLLCNARRTGTTECAHKIYSPNHSAQQMHHKRQTAHYSVPELRNMIRNTIIRVPRVQHEIDPNTIPPPPRCERKGGAGRQQQKM